MRYAVLAVAIIFLLGTTCFATNLSTAQTAANTNPDVYVGVDAAYGDMTQVKALIDNVSSYTNLFVVGCVAITDNATRLNDVCQYLYDRNLSFIIYQEQPLDRRVLHNAVSNWTATAQSRWGRHFLGFYYMDELGGKQLDLSSWSAIDSAKNYTDMATQYVNQVNFYVDWFKSGYSDWGNLAMFTSDYALYWYDYMGGYDTVFAEYGWNSSRQLNTALCRGAATAQGKDWGAIITWTYQEAPYIESAEDLYSDMVYAYNNGAKYIIVFDSDENYTGSILTPQHLDAIKQFWTYIQTNPPEDNNVATRSAVVLPASYGYGLRGPEDKIWGLWPADNVSYSLCVGINSLLEQYGTKLDIIYDSGLQSSVTSAYNRMIYWNDSSQFPDVMPTSVTLNNQGLTTLLDKYTNLIVLGVAAAAFVVAVIVLVVVKKTAPHKKATEPASGYSEPLVFAN